MDDPGRRATLSCGEIQDLLPDRVAGRLQSRTAGRIDGHLTGCAECREVLAAVRSLQGGRPPVPAGLEARIVAAVKAAVGDGGVGSSVDPANPEVAGTVGTGAREEGDAGGRPSASTRPGWRLAPAWGLAAAAVLALAIGLPVLSNSDPGEDTELGALALADEEVGGVWLDDDLMIAGAPAVSELSDEALARLLEELGR